MTSVSGLPTALPSLDLTVLADSSSAAASAEAGFLAALMPMMRMLATPAALQQAQEAAPAMYPEQQPPLPGQQAPETSDTDPPVLLVTSVPVSARTAPNSDETQVEPGSAQAKRRALKSDERNTDRCEAASQADPAPAAAVVCPPPAVPPAPCAPSAASPSAVAASDMALPDRRRASPLHTALPESGMDPLQTPADEHAAPGNPQQGADAAAPPLALRAQAPLRASFGGAPPDAVSNAATMVERQAPSQRQTIISSTADHQFLSSTQDTVRAANANPHVAATDDQTLFTPRQSVTQPISQPMMAEHRTTRTPTAGVQATASGLALSAQALPFPSIPGSSLAVGPAHGPAPSAPQATPAQQTAASSAQTPSPARQIAPALVSVMQTADGTQRMTLRLHPMELGTVQVRIERFAGGPAHIAITADRPETLQLLRNEQADLHHTLDHAGVPMEGRTVSFHTGPASQAAPDSGKTGTGNTGQDNANGTPGRQQNGQASNRRALPVLPLNNEEDAVTDQHRWRRVGLDISA